MSFVTVNTFLYTLNHCLITYTTGCHDNTTSCLNALSCFESSSKEKGKKKPVEDEEMAQWVRKDPSSKPQHPCEKMGVRAGEMAQP